jgi:hypothetical protein
MQACLQLMKVCITTGFFHQFIVRAAALMLAHNAIPGTKPISARRTDLDAGFSRLLGAGGVAVL